jgi:hypothetical protein
MALPLISYSPLEEVMRWSFQKVPISKAPGGYLYSLWGPYLFWFIPVFGGYHQGVALAYP